MRFVNPLPFVADVEASKRFYRDGLGLEIAEDHGDFVRFEGGFALHEGTSLLRTVFGAASPPSEPYGRRNLVLYFESARLEEDFARLAGLARIVHPIRAEPWGQRVFRLLDPDGHIVEIGEPQALWGADSDR